MGKLEDPLKTLLNFCSFCYTFKLGKYFDCFVWLLNQEKAKITLGGRKLNKKTHVPLPRRTHPACCSFGTSYFPSACCSRACRGPSKPHGTPALCSASCLLSPESLQGHAGVRGPEVVRAWGKTGQGTWLVPFCSTPLMCLYMRFYHWMKYFVCEVLCFWSWAASQQSFREESSPPSPERCRDAAGAGGGRIPPGCVSCSRVCVGSP